MRCEKCQVAPLQVFPCFACGKAFCLEHVLEHSCISNARLLTFIPPPDPPSKLSIAQYTRLGGLDSTICLELLNPRQSTAKWSADKESLSGAHHVFPKGALVWVYEHLTQHQQAVLKKILMLPPDAGGLAMTRLRSNLITPLAGKDVVRPEGRDDDAHHHGGSGLVGEEFLDLVRTHAGVLEHRSRLYQMLAWFVAQIIAPRFFDSQRSADFRLSDGEATIVATLILQAEVLQYYLEEQPEMPSFHGSEIWDTGGEKYHKTLVPDRSIPDYLSIAGKETITLLENFFRKKRAERRQSARTHGGTDDPPRLRLFRTERLGGFEVTSPLKGSRRWLLNKLSTQLEVDFGACLSLLVDRLDAGRGRWTEDATKLVKDVSEQFRLVYDALRETAATRYKTSPATAFRFLPCFRGAVDPQEGISIWIENDALSEAEANTRALAYGLVRTVWQGSVELVRSFREYKH